jgi:UDP-N-acetylmuramoyl-tripeptide--D-alanyl-D-alanine ligase
VAAFGAGAQHFASPEALVNQLKPLLTPATAVLVKGSRFMRMERVVALLESPGAADPKKGAAPCC